MKCRASLVATWRAVLGERAEVLTREEATALGWFGSLDEAVAPRVGEVIRAAPFAAGGMRGLEDQDDA